jgi:hypothetical protein
MYGCGLCKKNECPNNYYEDEYYCNKCFKESLKEDNGSVCSKEDNGSVCSKDNESILSENDEDDEDDEDDDIYDPSRQLDAETTTKIKIFLDKKKYKELETICDLHITYVDKFHMTYIAQYNETNCSICFDNINNCQIRCGHTFCINCVVQNNIIIGSNNCAICREFIDNNIILLNN